MPVHKLSVTLRTPVALGHNTYWTLDGVCFGILDEARKMGVNGLDPVGDIPIRQTSGLFHASAVVLQAAVERSVSKIGGIRPIRDMADATAFIAPGRSGRIAKIATTRGASKAHLSRYREINAAQLFWLFESDIPERVVALVRNARALGALRKDGYGLIEDASLETSDARSPFISHDGTVTRPIPVALCAELGVAPVSPRSIETWRPPYWQAENRAECFVPRAFR